jgi:hypothetical protein
MIRLLLPVWASSLGLLAMPAQAAESPPSTAKVSKMKGPPQRFELAMDVKAAEAVLKHHDVQYDSRARKKPVPGRSLIIQGRYGFGGAEVDLYFVDNTLWEIKLRRSEGLCEQHTADLGPPVRQKDGCEFWFDKQKLFSAFYCPATSSRSERPECFIVSLLPLEKAGLSRALLEQEFKAMEPPPP